MKKKIDFRKIEAADIEGNISVYDLSKTLGNAIYRQTADLGELELAREIYKKGEVEIDQQQASLLSGYIKTTFLAFIQEVACPMLDNLFTNK